jgi:hypothetical protein
MIELTEHNTEAYFSQPIDQELVEKTKRTLPVDTLRYIEHKAQEQQISLDEEIWFACLLGSVPNALAKHWKCTWEQAMMAMGVSAIYVPQ